MIRYLLNILLLFIFPVLMHAQKAGEHIHRPTAVKKPVHSTKKNEGFAKQNNNNQNQKPQQGNTESIQQNTVSIVDNSTNKIITINGVSFTMIYVEGGTFQMGSNDSEADSNEKPVHSVTLSSYYIGQTEVTQAQWKAVMGNNPSNFRGDKLPVEQVSWDDSQIFISKLSQLTGENFRLLTEAEWEYAARGGNKSHGYKYAGSNTIDNVAWYGNNSGDKTHNVATKQPNELGIYDMSGNVYEWCQDRYGDYSNSSQTNPTGTSTGSRRVIHGGSWFNDAEYCRSSNRNDGGPTRRDDILGLRLAL